MDVLVVESPAKAKTIGKYLGPGYTVLASYGHVRDLPPKDGSVRPDEDFAMDWEVDPQSQKRLDAIAKAITKGGKLYLATDPDREGEAISWHVRDVLNALSRPAARPAPAPLDLEPETDDEAEGAEGAAPDAGERLAEALSAAPLTIDELIRSCQLSPPVVNTILLEWELAGRIERLPGNRIAMIAFAKSPSR
jgi:hypothetical protein